MRMQLRETIAPTHAHQHMLEYMKFWQSKQKQQQHFDHSSIGIDAGANNNSYDC